MEVTVLAVLLALSLAANAIQWRLYKKPPPQKTIDATQILRDLTRGDALVKISRVDPENILLWSPKGRE